MKIIVLLCLFLFNLADGEFFIITFQLTECKWGTDADVASDADV